MRITATTKSFFLLLFAIAALVALVLYFILYQEHIAMIIGGCLAAIACCMLLYISLAPLFTSLAERADTIMAIYVDASGKGLHIFSSYSTSGGRMSTMPLRTIQYYFLLTEKHSLLYKKLFSYFMKPLSGRSGYEGFNSFEENVLGGLDFKAAIAGYSAKAGQELNLGQQVAAGENKNYETTLDEYTYSIQTSKGINQHTLMIHCNDSNGKTLWKKKL